MILHPAENSLYRRSTVENGLPFWSLLIYPFLVGLWCPDDTLCPPLPLNNFTKFITTVSSITDNVLRFEFAVDVTSL